MLESELHKAKFDPRKVLKVNESGMSIVQGTRTNVLSVKQKQDARLSTTERVSSFTTVVACMSAMGYSATVDCVSGGQTETKTA
jgi:hypothetical protein